MNIIYLTLAILLLHLVCLSSTTSTSNDNNRHKSVSISLYSNWKDTPLYLEALEFLAEENDEYLWSFIDALHDQVGENAIAKMSPSDQYEIIIELAHAILSSESKVSLLKFSLAMRAHSPTIEMFHQMAVDVLAQKERVKDDCHSFVELSVPSSHDHIDNFINFDCDKDKVSASIESYLKSHKDGETKTTLIHPSIYKVDHIYPSQHSHTENDNIMTAILYGQVGTQSFHELHLLLSKLADEGKIKYIMRHYMKERSPKKVSLSGYGVELAIKSTEYKAQDDTRVKGEETSFSASSEEPEKPDEVEGFIFSKLKAVHPDKVEKLQDFQSHLLDSFKEIATLKVWELQELSLQAAKKILTSPKSDALKMLREISQNFPTLARSLIKISVNNEMKREIDRNQQIFMQNLNLSPTDTAIFINGLYYDGETVDIFTLLNVMKQEIKLVEGLHDILGSDSDGERLKKLIKMEVNAGSSDKNNYQVDIRDGAIIYANDIESDSMYKNWPSSVQDMLRAVYPGMMRNVRRNMFHLVLVVDPSKKESHDVIKLSESFYVHKAPVRIGFVFAVSPDNVDGYNNAGIACLEAFNFISQDKTPYDGLSFLTDVIANVNAKGGESRDLKPSDVINHFKSKYKNEDLDMVFGADSDYDTGRKLAWEFINKTGIGSPVKALLNGVVLKESHLNAELFEEVVLTEIMKQTNVIQKAVYTSELTDGQNVLDWLMSQKSVMPRLNNLILNPDVSTTKYLDLTGDMNGLDNDYSTLKVSQLHSVTASSMKYIYSDDKTCAPVTLWLAINCETQTGRNMLLSLLSHLRSNSRHMRVGIIYNQFGSVSKIIESALMTIEKQSQLLQFLIKFINHISQKESNSEDSHYADALQILASEHKEKFEKVHKSVSKNSQVGSLHATFCNKALTMGKKDLVVILNGRIIQVPLNEPFIEDDFSLIEKYAVNTFAEKFLKELTEEEKSNPKKCSDLIMKLSSVVLANQQTKARHDITFSSDKHSALVLPPKEPDQPYIETTVILDPLTRGAQKLASILITFQRVFNTEIKILFNCVDKHSDLPLKSFFRYVIDSEPIFDDEDGSPFTRAHFASVPTSPLLTLGMATPDNWLVQSVKSPYDLDNIHLEQVQGSGIWADFELEYLLLEGHCFELSSGNPPRGLQFTLGALNSHNKVDTIVMANLGYFQLKANPGSWLLELRHGRSSEIYNIISHEGAHSPPNSPRVVALISNFRSQILKVRVNKKPGKQYEELLYESNEEEDEDSNSIWSSFQWNSDKKKGDSPSSTKENENSEESNKINIFSLATGHLYERLMRIMILSVLKHTKSPVKFWFLKNYLSPSFKEVLPHMAEKYKFEYELVQYKWPRWLHQQTEKQRIIWGYKILFLDVLFPLDIKKIIFVDADQVVRADLKELVDLDLEGAPYGYTPFCESRKEMDGFRFWKSGYWAVHLHGRRYHISALYVVDLQKFRRIAAGDRLRGQYQGLSQDPNSLSNLDQDLPNNMIHQVSIKSLPQEWLWCETWCDDKSKKSAKTIDLCNNPQTKEPKLTAARRIIPEWEGYDNEIKKFISELDEMKKDSNVIQGKDEL